MTECSPFYAKFFLDVYETLLKLKEPDLSKVLLELQPETLTSQADNANSLEDGLKEILLQPGEKAG